MPDDPHTALCLDVFTSTTTSLPVSLSRLTQVNSGSLPSSKRFCIVLMESLLQPGRHFKHGEFIEELPGELEISEKPVAGGGFANIHHGFWTDQYGVRTEVAIKEIRPPVPNANHSPAEAEEIQRKRIGRELYIWSQTTHKNLQPLIGYQSQPRPRLICPWARHGNLTDYLQHNPGLSRLEKLHLIYQTGLGLCHLHTRNPPICHADIKPENVLINDSCEAALCDFGISRVLGASRSGFTTSVTAKGTMAYMAPELFLEENTSLQSDVYAFGGLILKVMTGKAPFYSLTNQDFIFAQVVKGHWPDPQAYPELPVTDLLWRLIRRCWARDRDARPTMQDVLAELSLHIQSEALGSRSTSLIDPPRNTSDSNPPSQRQEAKPLSQAYLFAAALVVIDFWLQAIPVLAYVWKITRLRWIPDPEIVNDLSFQTSSSTTLAHSSASTSASTITVTAGTTATHTIGSIVEKASVVGKILEQLQSKLHVVSLVGRYIEALANVGRDLIGMTQTYDADEEISRSIILGTWRLAQLVEDLQDKIKTPNNDLSPILSAIQRELQGLGEGVMQQRRFYQEDSSKQLARQVAEEIEFLLQIDTKQFLNEATSSKAQDERRQLLSVLGDGRHGLQGNMIGEAVCLPGTRVEVLDQIDDWVRSTNPNDRALWVRGMAGRGKSTIASTVVQRWKYRASCAIFHFRRGQSNLDPFIICSLAKQLGNSMVTKVRDAIAESVRHHPDIAEERLDEQLKTLVISPLSGLGEDSLPALIVVDGLDECENTPFALELLKLIDQHAASLPPNVKFLFTSRPELEIRRAFNSKAWGGLNLDSLGAIQNDLRLFVQHGCEQIRAEHNLHKHWPSKRQVNQLADMSQGLFQWARTAIAFIGKRSPEARLRDLITRPWAWNGLTDIYRQILDQAFTNLDSEPEKQELLRRILGTLVVAPHPMSLDVIATLFSGTEIFQGLDHEAAIKLLHQEILADLNSLILIPNSSAEPVHLLHASIRDLFMSKQRCEGRPYQIESTEQHKTLATLCLRFALDNLKKNICNIEQLSTTTEDVREKVEDAIGPCLRYSCRAWAIHLSEAVNVSPGVGDGSHSTWDSFVTFSKTKVLCWLEVMAFIGATTEAINVAAKVQQWLSSTCSQTEETKQLARLWYDIQRFVITFSDPISFSPAHIYASGLAHCPENTLLWKWYAEHVEIRTLGAVKTSTWSSEIWTRVVDSTVTAAVFSSDGKTLVTSSGDAMLRLWNPLSGTLLQDPLSIGHTDWIQCLAFSPDDKILASGSSDCTVRLWDAQNGVPLRDPLEGHTSTVMAVAFTPDGQTLASGSSDRTIRLWNVSTGAMLKDPLEGHVSGINSVAFSPDGKILASGSNDYTIRIWDPDTGALLRGPLEGHTDWVRSVSFSPDGHTLASGSDDWTIRLWDVENGTLLRDPLLGHTSWVRCVTFSPDGQTLASGADDYRIRLWDAHGGTGLGDPLEGHNGNVVTVAFSPDSKTLASGSGDYKVRLWDVQRKTSSESLKRHSDLGGTFAFAPDGKTLATTEHDLIRLWDTTRGVPSTEPLAGHTTRVQCISFSSDSHILASGSEDGTIRLWDLPSGKPLREALEGHAGWVQAVKFSPDGKTLASGDDTTVRLWDVETGALKGVLEGHTDRVLSVGFSPDGEILASGSVDRTIRLWEVHNKTPLRGPFEGHWDWVRSVAFSPDGKIFASSSDDCTIRLWNVSNGESLGDPLNGHTGWVWSVAFAPDGRTLISSSRDRSIRLWDVPAETPLESPQGAEAQDVTSPDVQDSTASKDDQSVDDSEDNSKTVVVRQVPKSSQFWPGNIAFDGDWITLFGKKFLWLPPEYQDQMNFENPPPIAIAYRTVVIILRDTVCFFQLPHDGICLFTPPSSTNQP